MNYGIRHLLRDIDIFINPTPPGRCRGSAGNVFPWLGRNLLKALELRKIPGVTRCEVFAKLIRVASGANAAFNSLGCTIIVVAKE